MGDCPCRVLRQGSAESFSLLDVHAEHWEKEESLLELPEEAALVPEAALSPVVVAMAKHPVNEAVSYRQAAAEPSAPSEPLEEEP